MLYRIQFRQVDNPSPFNLISSSIQRRIQVAFKNKMRQTTQLHFLEALLLRNVKLKVQVQCEKQIQYWVLILIRLKAQLMEHQFFTIEAVQTIKIGL